MKRLIVGLAVVIGFIAVLAGMGMMLPAGHVAATSVNLSSPVDSVWRVVRDLGAYDEWWPDVDSVARLSDVNGREAWYQRGAGGPIPLEVRESTAPTRLVTRIIDDGLPFGGTWTYVIQPRDGGSRVTISERGKIYNPIFRIMARLFFGYHGTQESYLTALAVRFGDEPVLERMAFDD